MEWVGEAQSSRGVTEREFRVQVASRTVPGVLWTPEETPQALVLLGHGGSNHKRADYILAIARQLVRRHGFAAMAIDGPTHGARRSGSDQGIEEGLHVQDEFTRLWASDRNLGDSMNEDWTGALDAVQALADVGDKIPVGYWGWSLGTLLGLPFVAQEPRIAAATLGLMGTGENGRLATSARNMTCPTMFFVQRDDQLIPREGALRLFDYINSDYKLLRACPGDHSETPADEFTAGIDFLAQQLKS